MMNDFDRDSDPECIYALDVFVSLVKCLKPINLPAISFKLSILNVSYPTIPIYNASDDVIERLKVNNLVLPHDAQDAEHLIYKFSRGKSCLFQCRPGVLYKSLQTTPLLVMLTEMSSSSPPPPTAQSGMVAMVGSAFISLFSIFPSTPLSSSSRTDGMHPVSIETDLHSMSVCDRHHHHVYTIGSLHRQCVVMCEIV